MPRCWWAGTDPAYVAYHDDEWGRPVIDDRAIFEKLSLEAFQSGLSWLTILRKRDNFRAAFDGFDVELVASYGDRDVQRLLADAGIVRNRAKIEATINNARAVKTMAAGLAEVFWSHAPSPGPAPRTVDAIPATTPESVALARSLKKAGFRFVGPTTCYAAMQSLGLVNDHVADCEVRAACESDQRTARRAMGLPVATA